MKVIIYSYNLNQIEREEIIKIEKDLDVTIFTLSISKFVRSLLSKKGSFLRAILSRPALNYLELPSEIQKKILSHSDYIWIYGEDIGHFSKYFNAFISCVVTGPDCEALYYWRMLGCPEKLNKFFTIVRYSRAYGHYLSLTKDLPYKNVFYHLVGDEDAKYLTKVNSKLNVEFINHPHYEGNLDREIGFSSPKIRLLISGRNDFYVEKGINEAIGALIEHSELRESYSVTFQGKGWSPLANKLRGANYEVTEVGFVTSYKDELCCHDVLLSTIGVGTGTKGKVLDAFINGLLVVGTLRSVENIQVRDKEHYFLYEEKEDLIKILKWIATHKEQAEKIAISGRERVLQEHGIKHVSDLFYSLFPNLKK
ncbi:MAG: glycosyltransferase family 4 protein [Bacteroidales bacterium]|nr:glycosyltransferase family 4 protein [Bacteroidales bacterium]